MCKWNHLFGLVSFYNILRKCFHFIACRWSLIFIVIYILQEWITFSVLIFVLLWTLLPFGENEAVICIFKKCLIHVDLWKLNCYLLTLCLLTSFPVSKQMPLSLHWLIGFVYEIIQAWDVLFGKIMLWVFSKSIII